MASSEEGDEEEEDSSGIYRAIFKQYGPYNNLKKCPPSLPLCFFLNHHFHVSESLQSLRIYS